MLPLSTRCIISGCVLMSCLNGSLNDGKELGGTTLLSTYERHVQSLLKSLRPQAPCSCIIYTWALRPVSQGQQAEDGPSSKRDYVLGPLYDIGNTWTSEATNRAAHVPFSFG